jgi:hypothetical protein
MVEIENRGGEESESKYRAMSCALHCYLSSTYSSYNHTLIIDVIASVKMMYSLAAMP